MRIDYSQLPLPNIKNPRYQTQPLPDKDHYDLKVVAKLLNKPVSQVIGTAIGIYLDRNVENHTDRLKFRAAQEGKSPEEMYRELAQLKVQK